MGRPNLEERRRLREVGICTDCGKNPAAEDGNFCEDCRARRRQHYANRDQTAYRKRQRKSGEALKARTFAAYGSACSCCGETEPKFLTIDHIEGREPGDRQKGGKLYRWLERNGYPAGFRLLCWNCNCARSQNGGICPHEEQRARRAS